ncbi:uncharacterized protein LOC144146964 isoform X2 [Haemaphysalis longicornis]
MIGRLSLLLLCICMPLAAKAETCGGRSGPACNISLVYAGFKSAYLAAMTPDLAKGLCVVLFREENNRNIITAYFKNGTFGSNHTEDYTFTDAPDVVNATLDSGCRLWMFRNATSAQVTACTETHAQACPGTIYDSWDEESCPIFL